MNNRKSYILLTMIFLLSLVLLVKSSTIIQVEDSINGQGNTPAVEPVEDPEDTDDPNDQKEDHKEEEKEDTNKEQTGEKEDDIQTEIKQPQSSTQEKEPEQTQTTTTTTQTVEKPVTNNQNFEKVVACDYAMNDCLLIGDSRLDDMKLYGNIRDADFFSAEGLSLLHYQEKPIYINSLGRSILFMDLMQTKQYNKVYIMMGLNDLGRNFELTTSKYDELVNIVKTYQPNAKIIIMSNLHTTKAYTQQVSYEGTPSINRFNERIRQNVNGSTVLYMDSNLIFDDNEGYLRADLTNDGVHPQANRYATWSEWIKSESRRIFQDH